MTSRGAQGPATTRMAQFSLSNGSTEGQEIFAAQGRGSHALDSGDNFAIADGGFVYIGTDDLSDQSIWRQCHKGARPLAFSRRRWVPVLRQG